MQLWSLIGGGSTFTFNEILIQISACLTAHENFKIVYHTEHYEVPIDEIEQYFQSHPRPPQNLTASEEKKMLLDQIQRLEGQIALLKTGKGGPAPAAKPVSENPEFDPLDVDLDEKLPISVDEPPAGIAERKTFRDLQAELAKDLENVKPISNR